MNKRLLIIFTLILIGTSSCKVLLNNTNKTVFVYKLPFSNSHYVSTYYVEVTIDNFKKHNDIKQFIIKNKRFYTSLNDFISKIGGLSTSKELNGLDIRVLIEYKNKEGNLIQIGLDETGMFTVNSHIYNPNDNLTKIITQYTNIQWE